MKAPASLTRGPGASAGGNRRSVTQGLVQRACACGGSAGLAGRCGDCDRERTFGRRGLQTKLQVGLSSDPAEHEAERVADAIVGTPASRPARRAGRPALPASAPATIARWERPAPSPAAGAGLGTTFGARLDAEQGAGLGLDAGTRAFMEPRFGVDFAHVQVHTSRRAAELAGAVNAQAFTLGSHIFFGAGRYDPGSGDGRRLLAHELAHTIQQDSAGPGLIRRVPVGEFFARFFGGGTFSDDELLAYLRYLDVENRIEDDNDSDNKARVIVQRWKAGDDRYALTVRRKVLLIEEMISGFTGDDDERAILDLLQGSRDAELAVILDSVGEARLRDEFHFAESDELDRFLAAWHARHEAAATRSERAAERQGGARTAKPMIREIVVDQSTTQTVTVHWSDGRTETDIASTGKGQCCVEPGADGPTAGQTQVSGSAWTPVGRFPVAKKIPVTGGGVRLWTEFVDPRDIALHEYFPVDGTPLSHGCVRLNEPMARTIYDGSVVNRTVVVVQNTPRPRCDHPLLQREWGGDFAQAGRRPPDGESPEAARERRSIRRTRRQLGQSLEVSQEELTSRTARLEQATGGFPRDITSSREARARTLRAIAPIAPEIPRCQAPQRR